MPDTLPLNAPLKNCKTCAHCQPLPNTPGFSMCNRFQLLTTFAANTGIHCGDNLTHWRPIPPPPSRRSLRRWLYDIFWA